MRQEAKAEQNATVRIAVDAALEKARVKFYQQETKAAQERAVSEKAVVELQHRLELADQERKTAVQQAITEAIKVLGNGSMQEGLTRVASYFTKESAMIAAKSLSKGRFQGVVIGAVGATAVCGGIALAVNYKKRQQKDHDAEGRKILSTMTDDQSETTVS